MSYAVKKRLAHAIGRSGFNFTFKSQIDAPRRELFTLWGRDPKIVDAMKRMFDGIDSCCPKEENPFMSDPQMGDLSYAIRNWDKLNDQQKGYLTNFLHTIFDNVVFKKLGSAARLESTIRARYAMPQSQPFRKSMPGQGGQSYTGQPTPSSTWVRHEIQKAGESVIPSNLSSQQGKGDLVPPTNPEALMQNQSLPIVISTQTAMTDLSTFEAPTTDEKHTLVSPPVATSDTKSMQNQPKQVSPEERTMDSISVLGKRKHPMPELMYFDEKGNIIPNYDLPQIDEKRTKKSRSTELSEASIAHGKSAGLFGNPDKLTQLSSTVYNINLQGTGGAVPMGGTPGIKVEGAGAGASLNKKPGEDTSRSYVKPGISNIWTGIMNVNPYSTTNNIKNFYYFYDYDSISGDPVTAKPTEEPETETPTEAPTTGPPRFKLLSTESKGSYQELTDAEIVQQENRGEKGATIKLVKWGAERVSALWDEWTSTNLQDVWKELLDRGVLSQDTINNLPQGTKGVTWDSLGSGLQQFSAIAMGASSGLTVGAVKEFVRSKTGSQFLSNAAGTATAGIMGYMKDKFDKWTNSTISYLKSTAKKPVGMKKHISWADNVDKNLRHAVSGGTSSLHSYGFDLNFDFRKVLDGTFLSNEEFEHTTELMDQLNYEYNHYALKVNTPDAQLSTKWLNLLKNRLTKLMNSQKEIRDKIKKDPGYIVEQNNDVSSRMHDVFDFLVIFAAGLRDSRIRYSPERADIDIRANQNGVRVVWDSLDSVIRNQMFADTSEVLDRILQREATAESNILRSASNWMIDEVALNTKKETDPLAIEASATEAKSMMKSIYNNFQILFDKGLFRMHDFLSLRNHWDGLVERVKKSKFKSEFANLKWEDIATAFANRAIETVRQEVTGDISHMRGTLSSSDQEKLNKLLDNEMVGAENEKLGGHFLREFTDLLGFSKDTYPYKLLFSLGSLLRDNWKQLKTMILNPVSVVWSAKDRDFVPSEENTEYGKTQQISSAVEPRPKEPTTSTTAPISATESPTEAPTPSPTRNPKPIPKPVKPKLAGGPIPTETPTPDEEPKPDEPKEESKEEALIPVEYPDTKTMGLLRPFFSTTDANIVTQINEDPKLKQINQLTWTSFNAYDWEPNMEGDNDIQMMYFTDEARRFSGKLDGEELWPQMEQDAVEESYAKDRKTVFRIPDQVKKDGNPCTLDQLPPPHKTLSTSGTETLFHDVYLPPWIEIPASSMWNTFTPIEGTQLPDSMIHDPERLAGHDWPMLEMQNRPLIYSEF